MALSGPVEPAKLEPGLDVIRSWGHPVVRAGNLSQRDGYLAGSDEARLAGLDEVLDAGATTIIAARGGFGATRLLAHLPWDRLRGCGVRVVGFSDLTAVLDPLASTTPQVHGPMVAAGLGRPENAARLHDVLFGRLAGSTLFRFADAAVRRPGRAVGKAIGGNLTLMASLMGTAWEVDLRDAVLFLEETGESPYRIDRLLTQLAGSSSWGGLRAVVCGAAHRCRPHADSIRTLSRVLLEATSAEVPVICGLPFGHGARNMAFPLGVTVAVDTARGAVKWRA